MDFKEKKNWAELFFHRNGSIFVKQVLEKFRFLFLIGLKSMFIVNFATNRYFLPVNIVNNVFCGTFLGCIWSNHLELILWIKLSASPLRSKLLRRTFMWYCFLPHTRCFELSFNCMDQVLCIRPSNQMRAFCFQLFSIRNLKKDGHT